MIKTKTFFFEPLLNDVVKRLKQEGVEVWPKTCSQGVPFVIFKGNMGYLAEDMPRHAIELTASNTCFIAEVIFDDLPVTEKGRKFMNLFDSKSIVSYKNNPDVLRYDDSFVEEIATMIIRIVYARNLVDKFLSAIGA